MKNFIGDQMNNREDFLDLLDQKLSGVISEANNLYVEKLLQENKAARDLWEAHQQRPIEKYLRDLDLQAAWEKLRRVIADSPND